MSELFCQLDASGLFELQAEIFYAGIVQAELLRVERRRVSGPLPVLLCKNILFEFCDPHADGEAWRLLSWPHWLLKLIYTDVKVVFGKFVRGRVEHDGRGLDLPAPPCHFLSVRSGVSVADDRFFSKTPDLLPAFRLSSDDGCDVHRALGFPACDLTRVEGMRAAGYYEQVLERLNQLANSPTQSGSSSVASELRRQLKRKSLPSPGCEFGRRPPQAEDSGLL